MAKLQQFSFVCAPSMVQYAGVVALDQDLTPRIDAYRRKRDAVADALSGLFDLPRPEGAFYAFPRAPWGTATDPNWFAGPYAYLKASPWKVIGRAAGRVSIASPSPET